LIYSQCVLLSDKTVQDFANADLGLTFAWPKHHNLDHTVDILQQKGPTDNYETGIGESLHLQVKSDYERSSGQPETTDIQVTSHDQLVVLFLIRSRR